MSESISGLPLLDVASIDDADIIRVVDVSDTSSEDHSGPGGTDKKTPMSALALVTAFDEATGQLQIRGHEVGDTGWRKILSWTAGVQDGADQIDTINTGVWTLTGNGNVQIRRIGSRVLVNFETGTDASAGIAALSTGQAVLCGNVPDGFYPANRHMGPIGQHPHGASAPTAVGIGRFTTAGTIDVNIRYSGAPLANCEGSFDVLGAAWPATLPGVPA